jgi:hypothetical protein
MSKFPYKNKQHNKDNQHNKDCHISLLGKIARDLLVKGWYGYDLVPPERFELPAPAFVAQCSNPNELRWCIEFASSSVPHIATIFPCN